MAVTRAVQNLRQAYEDYMGGMEEEPSEEEKRRAVRACCCDGWSLMTDLLDPLHPRASPANAPTPQQPPPDPQTTSMMPEYVLPYLLHLLAHFPDFPTSHDDSVRWRQLAK